MLTIGLEWDCKFKRDGAPAATDILRKSAYLKVSYFATIFTGNLAVEVEANPSPQVISGVVERITPSDRKITIQVNHGSRLFTIRWAVNARFLHHGKAVSPAKLKTGMPVNIRYYSPPFENRYAIKIE